MQQQQKKKNTSPFTGDFYLFVSKQVYIVRWRRRIQIHWRHLNWWHFAIDIVRPLRMAFAVRNENCRERIKDRSNESYTLTHIWFVLWRHCAANWQSNAIANYPNDCADEKMDIKYRLHIQTSPIPICCNIEPRRIRAFPLKSIR